MMARSRVYRFDIQCPDFGSNRMRKDGFTNGRQAYRRLGQALQAQGVARYPECGALSAVGRLLGTVRPPFWDGLKAGPSR